MVLVILALGVFVISLVPQDTLLRFNLETAVARVEQDLRYTKELALTTNTNYGINFVANGDYTVYQGTTATPVTNPLTKQSFVSNLSDDFTNVNILNSVQVEFDPTGKPVLGGGQTIQIGNGQTTASLLVTPNTGLIMRQ